MSAPKMDFDRGYFAGFHAALLAAHKSVDGAWLDSGRGKKANNEALEQVRGDLERAKP